MRPVPPELRWPGALRLDFDQHPRRGAARHARGPFRSPAHAAVWRANIDPTGQGQTTWTSKQIVDGYAVTPQLEPADMAALAENGVTTVICNRPDAENPPGLQAAAMQQAAEAAGLAFVFNPVTGRHADRKQCRGTGRRHRRIRGAGRGLLRVGQPLHHRLGARRGGRGAGGRDPAARAKNGYDLAWLRPQLEALAAQRGG
jgi:uncharacterized protein (TIGR01244 family)